MARHFGSSLADGTGDTTSSPWDFPQRVLEIFAKGSSDFLQVPGKGKFMKQEPCSGENIGDTCRGETTFLKTNLAEAELLAEACPGAGERGAQSRDLLR